jgi:site-specific DNA recombinase
VPHAVQSILRRRLYCGDTDWGKVFHGGYHGLEGGEIRAKGGRTGRRVRLKPGDFIIVENTHEPLVDRFLWEKVQARLSAARKLTAPAPGGGDYLLSGLMVCGRCGCRMVGVSRHCEARRYACNGYHTHGLRACHRHSVREAPVVACLVKKLQKDFLNPDNLELLRAEMRAREEEAAGADPARAKALEARLAALDRDIRAGNVNMARAPDEESMRGIADAVRGWREERARVAAELGRLSAGADRGELEAALAAAEAQLWRLRESIASADPAQVRTVFRELVDRVELYFDCSHKHEGRRQRCRFARGVIVLRPDERLNRLVPAENAAGHPSHAARKQTADGASRPLK